VAIVTRGRALVALLALALVSGGVGCAIVAHARGQIRVETTQVIVKEVETDLVRARMRRGAYPQYLVPEPVDSWGRPLRIEVPGPEGRPYRVLSYGADGLPGGRGPNADIVNWEY